MIAPKIQRSRSSVFFILKETGGYIIWEGTPEEMFERTILDRTLDARLDHKPFKTRTEAVARLIEILAKEPKPQSG